MKHYTIKQYIKDEGKYFFLRQEEVPSTYQYTPIQLLTSSMVEVWDQQIGLRWVRDKEQFRLGNLKVYPQDLVKVSDRIFRGLKVPKVKSSPIKQPSNGIVAYFGNNYDDPESDDAGFYREKIKLPLDYTLSKKEAMSYDVISVVHKGVEVTWERENEKFHLDSVEYKGSVEDTIDTKPIYVTHDKLIQLSVKIAERVCELKRVPPIDQLF